MKHNKKLNILIAVCVSVFILSVFIIAGICYFESKKPYITLKEGACTIVEYGKEISMNVDDYIDINNIDDLSDEDIASLKKEIIISSNVINEVDKDYPAVAVYYLKFEYPKCQVQNGDKKEYVESLEVNVEVKDTAVPVFNDLSEIKAGQGEDINFDEYVEAYDLSGIEKIEYDTSALDVNVPGEYIVKATAVDKNGLVSSKDIKVVVEKKKSNLNITKVSTSQSIDDGVLNYDFASDTGYIIDVISSGGSSANLSVYSKNGDGSWNKLFTVAANLGRNGISGNKHEGDNKTPTGLYSLGQAFGVGSNPGCTKSYLQVNDNYYWVDDSNSQYYNRLVNASETGIEWNSAEHLSDYSTAYYYAIAIDYNTSCTPGRGSAIFLHCSTGGGTAGCVAIPQSYMEEILRTITGDALIYIH